MLYLVCYDIADEYRLRKVAQVMVRYGERVQKSVFECHLTEPLLRAMLQRVQKQMEPTQDSLRVYPLCAACGKRRQAHGISTVSDPPEAWIL